MLAMKSAADMPEIAGIGRDRVLPEIGVRRDPRRHRGEAQNPGQDDPIPSGL